MHTTQGLFFILFISASVLAQNSPPEFKIGTADLNENCRSRLECKSPYHCLPINGSISSYTCRQLRCGSFSPCVVDQRCADGFCVKKDCKEDADCKSKACIYGKCQSKKASGDSCEFDKECYSNVCDSKICLSAEDPNQPVTRNRSADIALGILVSIALILALALCIICFAQRVKPKRRDDIHDDLEDQIISRPSHLEEAGGNLSDRARNAVGAGAQAVGSMGEQAAQAVRTQNEAASRRAAAAGDRIARVASGSRRK